MWKFLNRLRGSVLPSVRRISQMVKFTIIVSLVGVSVRVLITNWFVDPRTPGESNRVFEVVASPTGKD